MNDSVSADSANKQPGDDPRHSTAPKGRVRAPEQEQVSGYNRGYAKRFARQVFGFPAAIIKWLDSHDGLITALATIAIAVLTYYLAVYAGTQESILERQITDARITQRAFVVANWGHDFLTDGGKHYRFYVSWENRGNTPTRGAKVVLVCPTSKEHVADPLALAKVEMGMIAHRSIGPKENTDGGICDFDPSYIERVRQGSLMIYILAGAVYNDVFGENHMTLYCREIFGVSGPTFLTTPCEGYNCTDEECGNAEKLIQQ